MIEKYNDIFKEVLSKIRPEKKYIDTFLSEVNRIVSWFNVAIRSENIVAECSKGGSVAKGTFLKGDHDVDLFVKFSKEYDSKTLSEKLEYVMRLVSKKLKFTYKKVHGSRDYFQFMYRGIEFEVVPVLKIFNIKEAQNITDASPLHVNYIKKQISKKAKLADQVRLTKQFCKGIGVYGAESYINGLSGHAIDLLICFYGSFINFVSSTKYWNDKIVIDVDGKLKDPLKDLNKSKTKSPIILIDPVDNSRNATAALSKEKFDILKEKAQEFLDNPNIDFFIVKKMNPKKIKDKYKKEWSTFLKIEPIKDKSKDVQGTAILKAFKFMQKELRRNDFTIIDKGFDFEYIYIIIKKEELSSHVEIKGPPKRQRKACKEFIAKHKGRTVIFEKNKILYLRQRRKYKNPEQLIEKLIKDKYVTSRIKSLKVLKRVR